MMTKATKCQTLFSVTIVVLLSIVTSGCLTNRAVENEQHWMESGLLTLSRPAPGVNSRHNSNKVLGFMPTTRQSSKTTLLIDRQARSLVISKNGNPIDEMLVEALADLNPGHYTVVHKQRNPLWHATDQYFIDRNLEVPPIGAKARYHRGALGEFVVFLDKETPIHDSPVYCEAVGGIQVASNSMSRLYYQLEVGTDVEVK